MEIHIHLAGVQLGPYSEEQVRQHLSEGLLSPTDPAWHENMEDWAPLNEVLARLSNTASPENDADTPQPAPAAASEVSPDSSPEPTGTRNVSVASLVNFLTKKTVPIGPSAPTVPSPSGKTASSTAKTLPLVPVPPSTNKVSYASLRNPSDLKTTPLPTQFIPAPSGRSPFPSPSAADAPPSAQPNQKKAPFSLARELAAKTVPMRSGAAAPPVVAQQPLTTPMPTRPIFKPAPRTIPPQPAVHAPSALDHEADTNADSPEAKAAAPVKPEPSVPRQTKNASTRTAAASRWSVRRPTSRLILFSLMGLLLILALPLGYYLWSPYHAADALRKALNDGDPSELSAAIDFPAVQASLKDQTTEDLAQAGLLPAAGVSSSTLVAMLTHSIDLYVTPEGIAGLVSQAGEFSKNDQAQSIAPKVAANILSTLKSQAMTNQHWASMSDFALDWNGAVFHLQFQGVGWKLKRIDLPSLSGSPSPLIAPVLETYLESGRAKAAEGNWNGAIADLSQVVALDPRSSEAFQARGNARQAKGDLDGAFKDYTQALAIDPQMAASYHARGNIKAARNDLDGAIADYNQAIHFDPNLAAAYESRGNAKIARNDLDGAIADFTQALTLDPKLANAYSDRGFARQANGNLDGAISDYSQALALKPKTAVAYYNRGLAQQSKGNLDGAITDFDLALSFDPKIAGAYYNRGNAKNAKGELDDAIADFTQAVTLDPKIALAYCNRGVARQSKGDYDGAIGDYTQALAIDPKIALAYYNRGELETLRNNPDGAIADLSQDLDLDSKNAHAYYLRGFAKLSKGNLDGAQVDLKQFCDLAPKDPDTDHARLYLWLMAKARNAGTDPDQELTESLENNWNSSPDDLVYKTAAFLLGRMNEADYLAAATAPDAKTVPGRQCETWYFVGMKRLLAGDRNGATDAFQKAVATGQKDYCEYILAQAELQGLQSPPSPSPAKPPVSAPPRAVKAVPPAKNP